MGGRFFKTFDETKAWLDEMGVKGYTIQGDLTVDVNMDVFIDSRDLTHIPVQFGIVMSNFNCSNNRLSDLYGAPRRCPLFNGSYNVLTSLIGGPEKCRSFLVNNNLLTNLEHAPMDYHHLSVDDNHLTSLDGISPWCLRINCRRNPDLIDISAAPDGCRVFSDIDIIAKKQSTICLANLSTNGADGAGSLSTKTTRKL